MLSGGLLSVFGSIFASHRLSSTFLKSVHINNVCSSIGPEASQPLANVENASKELNYLLDLSDLGCECI